MVYWKTSLKSYEDVWREDKERLRKVYPTVPIHWENTLPTADDALEVFRKAGEVWAHPSEPFPLTQSVATEVANEVRRDIERVWEAELQEVPEIEIVPSSRYLERLNDARAAMGLPFETESKPFKSPPTAAHYPLEGRIYFPQKPLLKTVKQSAWWDIWQDSPVTETEWGRTFFRYIMGGEISHCLFRQLRGEWKEGYRRFIETAAPLTIKGTYIGNRAASQYAREHIADDPLYGAYAVFDKVNVLWIRQPLMDAYRAIDSLNGIRSLRQIAMVDLFKIEEDKVRTALDRDHYNFAAKARILMEGLSP